MSPTPTTPTPRSVLTRPRALTGTLVAGVAVSVLASPTAAYAVPAEGWPEAPEVSVLRLLTLVLLIPLGLAVVLGVAFALPGLASDRKQKSSSSVPATWMGGPKGGAGDLPEGSSATDDTGSDARGGSSARW